MNRLEWYAFAYAAWFELFGIGALLSASIGDQPIDGDGAWALWFFFSLAALGLLCAGLVLGD